MTFFDSIILGIVEGFTEFLPISSTAHLMLTSHLLGLKSDFVSTFEIAIQSGAMFAVVVIYWKSFFDRHILAKIITAFVPTAVIGFLLYKVAKSYLLDNLYIVVGTLAVGGIVLIVFEYFEKKRVQAGLESAGTDFGANKDIKDLSWGRTALVGVIQAIAIVPGVSRSAATIIGGRLLGLGRVAVVEFSFLLAVPTILSATIYDIYKNQTVFVEGEWSLLFVGFVTAFVTAFIGIRWLLSYIRKHSFHIFGVYRIILAILVLLFLI